jgi:hypothetical protein
LTNSLIADGNYNLDSIALQSIVITAAVVASTLHTQDFADVMGDNAMGRVTFPILFPRGSRVLTFIMVFTWSCYLTYFWRIGYIVSAAFVSLGALIALRFLCLRDVVADKTSYLLYNVRLIRKASRLTDVSQVWLILGFVLPINVRSGCLHL